MTTLIRGGAICQKYGFCCPFFSFASTNQGCYRLTHHPGTIAACGLKDLLLAATIIIELLGGDWSRIL
jgi:hypothetical protein